MNNPYASPQQPVVVADAALSLPRQYGGIGRLSFLGLWIGLTLVNVLIVLFAPSDLAGLLGPVVGIAAFALTYFQLVNIGMNPWWCLALVVPILNLLLFIRCLVMPEGYADTKEFDAVGKVAMYVACAVFVLLVAVAYAAILLLAYGGN